MKRMIKLFMFFCLVSGWLEGFSQNLSNRGKDFWVGYGHHQSMEGASPANDQEMVLYFSAEQAANVTVTINGTTWVRNYFVPAGAVIISDLIPKAGVIDARLISVPCSFVPPGTPCGGEGTFTTHAVHIVSDVPIVAYAHIYANTNSGASMLMPVETWGYSYVTLNSRQNYAANCFSWAYVIAQQNNTRVEITPVATTRSGNPAGVPYFVTLQRGQIYQFMAGPEAGASKPELSGTKIKSVANAAGDCYPIAVFAGSSRTNHPFTTCAPTGGGDNDNQQAFPTQTWGKRYLTAPTSNSNNASVFMTNAYKVATKDPTTVVRRNGTPLTGAVNGVYTFESNTAEYIEADKPIMVAQFMSGGGCQGGGGDGDPEMMYISPIEQGSKRVGFYRNDETNINVNYLTLVIPTNGVTSLRIDGSPAFDFSYPHPRLAGYTVVIKRWAASKSQAIVYSDSAFTAITYGLGGVESYGYNAGTLINNLHAVSSVQNVLDPATPQHPFTCANTPVKLSVLMAYQPTRLDWLLSQLGTVVAPNTDVIDNAPVSAGTVVINGITYYKYTLPGTYLFNTADTFDIPINGYHPTIENCYQREQIKIPVIVKEAPDPYFTFTHSGCTLDPINFSGQANTGNGFTVRDYNWTFPGPITATGQNVTQTLPPGTHNVNLAVVSSEGCVGDTTRQITVFDKPPANFQVTPAIVCVGNAFTMTDTSSAAVAVNEWYWDFGNGNTQTVTTGPSVTYTYPLPGTYTIKHASKSSVTCVSDTVTRQVTVFAKPYVDFTASPSGCLDVTGTVQFTGVATVADGQAITGYTWNFNDPNANAGNPNTSGLQNPTHNFQQGTYNVNLSAVTLNGCIKDTTITLTFNLKPQLAFTALAPVCENVAGTVSVANASVTNAVPGTGIYKGPATTTAGLFTPSVAGPGVHTIWYVFTTNVGCIDSIFRDITVFARPRPNFTFPNNGCLPASGQVQFTNTSTIADAQTMTWVWNFNDPNANAGNPNTSTLQNPTHNFGEGTFNINLQATSSNGCVKDTTIVSTFSVTPVLNYPALNALCENVAAVSVATATVTNGIAGTGVYSGPGTNAAGMFDPATAGPGTHTITYTYTTTGGCIEAITSNILVHARPRPNFTYPNSGCLPATGLVQFTNTSTIADAQTMVWAWNFNDPNANAGNPNTSALQNPTHNFLEGTYNINLQATSSNGCVKDTTIVTTFAVTPVLNYPALNALCENAAPVSVATATANGATGAGVYSGPGTDAAGMFNPAIAGPGTHTITYTYTTTGGCTQSITSIIQVHARPRPNFTFPTGACLPATGLVQINNTSTIADAQTMSWAWNFNDPNANAGNPNTSALQNPTHNFGEGTFNINLQAVSSNGCVKDTSINAVFSVTPALAYPALTAVCENVAPVSVATASATNGVTGTGIYSGPGVNAAGMFNPATAGPGTHTITYTFTTTGGCTQSITSNIQVHARPRPNFTFPTGACLPATGLVQFNNTSTIADAQTMVWAWNFNDPNANAGNPNTSALQNPTHNFGEGTFGVNLQVTSSNGCVKDTTINAVFSVTPALAYPALTAICESAAPVSVATATVTNGIAGTGVYSGPGTNAAGMFDPAAAGWGTHTITYTYTTTGGCTQSITSNILVHARPRPNFTFPAGTCLPGNGLVQFNNTTTIADAQTMAWSWNFNDPNAGAGNPNTSTVQNPTHNFGEGTFPVNLVATSSNGCVKDTTINAVFAVSPVLVYPPLNPVCQNPGASPSSIASASVSNNVTGTGVYSGPGTNASGLFDPNTAGPGIHTITFTFTTTGGCVQTITRTIEVYPRPNASFTATNSICLNQTTTLTSTSTISSGNIATWNWNLGDGNLPSYNNGNPFTVSYAGVNNYNVQLVAISDRGCFSTPASQTVAVHPLPVADFTVPVKICMPNGAAVFNNLSTVPDNSALTYQWNFGDGVGTSTATNPSYVYAGMGPYNVILTATSAFGCVNTSAPKAVVDFYSKPVASFTVTPDELCQGANTTFVDGSSAPNSAIQSWSWNFDDGTTSTVQTPVKQFTNADTYDIRLVVTNAAGCTSDPFIKTVRVHLQPVIDAGKSFVVPQGTSVQFEATANSPSLTFNWTPAIGLNNASALKPMLVAMADQTYTLTAIGEFGCTATDFMTVQILKPVKVPNIFSPNGDGIHDKWMIPNLTDYPGCTVEIFNRYGQQVFFSEGYGTPWDGRYKGKDIPVGVYFYIIQLKSGFKPMSGSVTIVR